MKRLPLLGLLLLLPSAPQAIAAEPAPPATEAPAPADPTPAAATPPADPTPAPPDPELERRRTRAKDLRLQGQEHARAGRLAEAAEALRMALDAYPAYPLALNELGTVLAQHGELVAAEAILVQALEHQPDFVDARANLAEIRRRLNRCDLAREDYRGVLEARPDDAQALYGLAACLLKAKQRDEALWALDRFVAARGDSDDPLLADVKRRAEALRDDDVDARIPAWAVAKDTPAEPADPEVVEPTEPTEPTEPAVVTEYAAGEPGALPRHDGDRHFGDQRYLDALAAYRAQLVDHADDVVLIYKIGATYAVMNDHRSALRLWRQALLLAPDRELLVRHVGLATMRLRADEPTPPASPGDPMEAARIALIRGDAASAIAHLSDQPGDEAEQLRGEARLLVGDLEGARAAFETILQRDPAARDAQGGLAEALVRLGAQAPAEAAMRAWLGDREVPAETFLVLRADDFVTRLTSEPEED